MGAKTVVQPSNINISNALSLYRLAAAPVAILVAFEGMRTVFVVLILISLFTDLIDGVLARWLKQETWIGARLDALADSGTLAATIIGALVFETEAIMTNIGWLVAALACLALATLVTLVKFGKLPAFHLYSFKATDVVLTVFFVVLFLYGFVKWLYVFSTLCLAIASLEIVAVALVIDEFRTNQKGLWWVLRGHGDPDQRQRTG
jgi:cardiolipin synthase